MTVRDLIEHLEQFDDNQEVQIGYPSGDYWNTVVCSSITEVEERTVEYSDYHRKNKISDDSYEDDEDYTNVVVLQ